MNKNIHIEKQGLETNLLNNQLKGQRDKKELKNSGELAGPYNELRNSGLKKNSGKITKKDKLAYFDGNDEMFFASEII